MSNKCPNTYGKQWTFAEGKPLIFLSFCNKKTAININYQTLGPRGPEFEPLHSDQKMIIRTLSLRLEKRSDFVYISIFYSTTQYLTDVFISKNNSDLKYKFVEIYKNYWYTENIYNKMRKFTVLRWLCQLLLRQAINSRGEFHIDKLNLRRI